MTPSVTSSPRRPAAAVNSGNSIPSLDGIRAIAFLIVFVSHAGLESTVPGGFGVTVFFFLSGYLITTLLRIEREKHGRIHLRDFYLRRVLRILPPFYTVLAIGAILATTGVISGALRWGPMAAVACHFGNFWMIRHGESGLPEGTGVYWSLAVEEHFYLLFPWIFEGLHRLPLSRKARAGVLLGFCALILAWRVVLVRGGASANRTNWGSDTRFDSILFGCALAIGSNPALDRSPIPDKIWRRVLLPIGLLGLTWAFIDRDPAFRETWRYTLQGISLVPIFVVGICQPSWGPMKFLNWGPIKFVGVLSYSTYLLHCLVLAAFTRHTPLTGPWPGLLGLAGTLALGWLIHITIERPAANLRRRLSHGSVPAAPAA